MSDLAVAEESTGTSERHASWAELFFDLVAVAGVAALAHVLEIELTPAALGLYALLFLVFWLSWTTFTLYSNIAARQTRVVRLRYLPTQCSPRRRHVGGSVADQVGENCRTSGRPRSPAAAT